MNSSLLQTTIPLIRTAFQKLRAFDWIESIGLPFAAAIMEAQPIILVLWLAGLVLIGKNTPIVLDPATILLLLLGFHWWAMGVSQFQQPGSSHMRTKIFHLVGLCLALALVVGMHLPLADQPLALFLSTIAILWCWRQGMMRVRANRRDEYMKTVFQRALFVMLAVLVLTSLIPSVATRLLSPLTLALPLFFLSGLVTFSLLRLQITEQAYRKRFIHHERADPTHIWSILVTLFWTSVTALILLIETMAFPLFVVIFAPLLALFANGYLILNAFLDALLQEKTTRPIRLPEVISLHKQLPPSPFHNSVLFVILTLIAFGTLGLILAIVVRIWYSNYHYTQEDEIRRGIALRTVLKERKQKRASSTIDQLVPTSIRAHYREFLRLMARHGTYLERLPHETPREYQKRLHSLLETLPRQSQERFPDTILDELTRAYIQERYGGKHSDDHPYTYWQTHIHAFVKHFRQRSRKRALLSIKEEV